MQQGELIELGVIKIGPVEPTDTYEELSLNEFAEHCLKAFGRRYGTFTGFFTVYVRT